MNKKNRLSMENQAGLAFIAIAAVSVLSGCASEQAPTTGDIAGYHNPWPGKGLYFVRDIKAGETITAADVEQKDTPVEKAILDQLCSKDEAVGATTIVGAKQGSQVLFHSLNGCTLKGSEGGQPRASLHVDRTTASTVHVVVSKREIPKGESICPACITELVVPAAEAPADAFHAIKDVDGQTSSRDIGAHEIVSAHSLESSAGDAQ
jgi:flagella basal body P-ring formation protein FlgA